jgi:hypothetical protein
MFKIFIWASKIMRKMATTVIWICWLSRANDAFHILQEAGEQLKVSN